MKKKLNSFKGFKVIGDLHRCRKRLERVNFCIQIDQSTQRNDYSVVNW